MGKYLFLTFVLVICSILHQTHAHRHKAHSHHVGSSIQLANTSGTSKNTISLAPRALEKDRCDANNECADKSCCNGDSGWCGRDPDHCAEGVCM